MTDAVERHLDWAGCFDVGTSAACRPPAAA